MSKTDESKIENKQLLENIEQLKAENEKLRNTENIVLSKTMEANDALFNKYNDLINMYLLLIDENEQLKKDKELLKSLSIFEVSKDYSQLKQENARLNAENKRLNKNLLEIKSFYKENFDFFMERHNRFINEHEALKQENERLNRKRLENKAIWYEEMRKNKFLKEENEKLKAQLRNRDKVSQAAQSTTTCKGCNNINCVACSAARFFDNHNAERKPHKCPVCNGEREIKIYDPIGQIYVIGIKNCKSCNGTGIVWEAK
jgi:hypothetical protein